MEQNEPVILPWPDVQDESSDLGDAFTRAFGSDGLGLLCISDLPREYATLRRRCLDAMLAFSQLSPGTRQSSSSTENPHFGWSHGIETMNGRPDLAKGSFYANPTTDLPNRSHADRATEHPSYFAPNIWPDERDVPGFRDALQELSTFVVEIGLALSRKLDQAYPDLKLHERMKVSDCHKARLLHYFPVPGQHIDASSVAEAEAADLNEGDDNLCGWHSDHSLLTGLVSAQYRFHPKGVDKEAVSIACPSSEAGLYVRPRSMSSDSKAVKVSIPTDCLAFQLGEALELLSGGRLLSTVHSVQSDRRFDLVPSSLGSGTVSRQTLAVFFQPDVDQILVDSPPLTFGQFTHRVLERHY